jgi:hypothetical protein
LNLHQDVNTREPRSFDGWALSTLISYDAVSPGILRFAVSASTLRRQTLFLVISQCHRDGVETVASRLRALVNDAVALRTDPRAQIAQVLMARHIRARNIVQALVGPVEGLVGVLGRLGDKPLHPNQYRTLLDILTSPEHKARAKVLMQVQRIKPVTLAVLLALKPPFLVRHLAASFGSVERVREFEAALDVIRMVRPEISDEELVTSLNTIDLSTSLSVWAERLISKASVFPLSPPIRDDAEFQFLGSAKALEDAAERFSNCLRSKIPVCALGRVAYIEYKPGPAIVELNSLSQGQWLLEGIYSPSNGPVDPGVVMAIRRRLNQAGVLVPARLAHARRFNKAAKFLSVYDFGSDLPDLDEVGDLQDLVGQVVAEFESA